ncbi:ribonuclease 3-like [Rhopilema esculentum]|uniref:ribonuclease 3-like n=1 Tax=Rhopilema esculentum TaxID=499914 RepID=UPI0031D8EA7C
MIVGMSLFFHAHIHEKGHWHKYCNILILLPTFQSVPRCEPSTNNEDTLYCYRISVNPDINFKARFPTEICHRGDIYEFDGFLLLTHCLLERVPKCSFTYFKRLYSITLHSENIPKKFCIKDLELFHKLVFEEYFEISDWNISGKRDSCRIFHFMPRFILTKDGGSATCSGTESEPRYLSMLHVLKHLMKSHKPLLKREDFDRRRSFFEEEERTMRESLVHFPGRKPACLRLDGLRPGGFQGDRYPEVLHYSGDTPKSDPAKNRIYEKLRRKRDNLRFVVEDCVLPVKKQLEDLRNIEREMEKMKRNRKMNRQSRVWLSSKNCYRTGLMTDVFQHTILLYAITDHIRYHKSLDLLERKINYRFKNRLFLETALHHVSLPKRLTQFSHIHVSYFNCGFSNVELGDGESLRKYSKRKGLENLSGTMSKLAETEVQLSSLRHNESLEFLGDSVLEIIVSSRLFFLFGTKSEGELSKFRSLLVGNAQLAEIAKRLELQDFMLFGHSDWPKARMDHSLANCVEAILAAVFLDGGYDQADKLLQFLHFEEKDLGRIWMDTPKHLLQARAPGSDRHLIERSPRLQELLKLEDRLGLTFNHISLLARAFTWSAADDDTLTCGNNQRLEFLGDSVLKFIISDYVYRHFPDHQEGHLTLLRTSLVNAKTQATVFRELGMDEFIDFAKETETYSWKIFANMFEAFIGAVFVDKGIEYCKKICEVTLFGKLESFIINHDWLDPKSKLQNCCAYLRSENNKLENPNYKILEVSGPLPHRTFKAAVYFRNDQLGVGIGKTIRAAESAAALNALESNHFEVQERQNRVINEKYGRKRINVGNSPSFPLPAKRSREEDEDNWEPKWIYI